MSKQDDEDLRSEMQEISNRINSEMCEIFERLAKDDRGYNLVAGATVLSLGWLLASLIEEEKAYGVDPKMIMISFLGVVTGHSTMAAESLFEAVSENESLLRAVIELIKKTDGDPTTDDDGGTLH
tara:strand:+ start:940 stop:1314 length:375 start_codon:yes stop_codon:yes gene_type:complete